MRSANRWKTKLRNAASDIRASNTGFGNSISKVSFSVTPRALYSSAASRHDDEITQVSPVATRYSGSSRPLAEALITRTDPSTTNGNPSHT